MSPRQCDRVLVTGGAGYLGERLLRGLADLPGEFDIVAYRHKAKGIVVPRVTWGGWLDVLRGAPYQCVFNLAADYGVGRRRSSAALIEANIVFPERLLASGIVDGGTFINIGTALPPFLGPYALSKHQFVEWLSFHSAQRDIAGVNAVLQHFYGPGDSDHRFPSWLLRQFLRGVPSVDLTHGRQRRDFIYVSDAVDALLEAFCGRSDFPHGEVAEVPIGTGAAVEVREFCQRMRAAVGASTELRFGARPLREGEPDVLQAGQGWLQSRGWRATVSLDDGVKRMIEGETV